MFDLTSDSLTHDFTLDSDQPQPFTQRLESLLELHKVPIGLALGGILLIGLGLLIWRDRAQPNQIEIITSEESSNEDISSSLAIDIAGAIQNPGIYYLPTNSRVEDLLIAAGGLSPDAHRDWIAQHLNRARRLADGEKLYIPVTTDTDLPAGSVSGASTSTSPISVNTATQAQLESLWGIGPVTAQTIIDGRPYSTLNELIDRKIIKQNVWDKNQERLSL